MCVADMISKRKVISKFIFGVEINLLKLPFNLMHVPEICCVFKSPPLFGRRSLATVWSVVDKLNAVRISINISVHFSSEFSRESVNSVTFRQDNLDGVDHQQFILLLDLLIVKNSNCSKNCFICTFEHNFDLLATNPNRACTFIIYHISFEKNC